MVGSASSRDVRDGAARAVACEPSGTTPFWYDGPVEHRAEPPPAPEWNAPGEVVQLLAVADSVDFSVPQPVSQRRLSFLPTASEVPPTAVTHGSSAGLSGCLMPVLASSSPLSPEEK